MWTIRHLGKVIKSANFEIGLGIKFALNRQSATLCGGWKFSDTETKEPKTCILAHLLRSEPDACVRSLGGETGHVAVSWFAFNWYLYLWSFLLAPFFNRKGVQSRGTLRRRGSWRRVPEWAGPEACVWTPETRTVNIAQIPIGDRWRGRQYTI